MTRFTRWIQNWVYGMNRSKLSRYIVKSSLILTLIWGTINPKVLIYASGIILIMYLEDIVSYVGLPKSKEEYKPTIDGIYVEDLVSFLFEYDGMPVEDMKRYFPLTNEQISKLGDNTDRVAITKKDPKQKNKRVLICQDPDRILKLLLSHTDSDKIGIYSESGVMYHIDPIIHQGNNA